MGKLVVVIILNHKTATRRGARTHTLQVDTRTYLPTELTESPHSDEHAISFNLKFPTYETSTETDI